MSTSRVSRTSAPSVVIGLVCCGWAGPATAGSWGESRQPIIYGDDDRLEFYEVDSEVLRERARLSTVAILYPQRLSFEGGAVTVNGASQSESYQLCSGEAFPEQPVAAFCSGVLIDEDLVLTAGHCLGESRESAEATCASAALVFGFLYEAPDRLAELTLDDSYRCRRVVSWRNAGGSQRTDEPDFAVIQLDRPVAGGQVPAPIAAGGVELGQRLNLVGFGVGLPAKIDSGAVVTDVTRFDEYFSAQTDTFGGASGSPLYDDSGDLRGVHTRGAQDWEFFAECRVAVRTDQGEEDHQRVGSAVEALCATNWPSESLCGVGSSCGDGVCSVDEDNEDCSSDCPLPACGDGRCEGAEQVDCDRDCNPFRAVPVEWRCPPEYFGDRRGCDCDCGARDPDCDDPREELLYCEAESFCNAAGRCESLVGITELRNFSPSGDGGDGCSVSVARPDEPFGSTARGGLGLLLAALWGRRRGRRGGGRDLHQSSWRRAARSSVAGLERGIVGSRIVRSSAVLAAWGRWRARA